MSLAMSIVWFIVALILFVITVIFPIVCYIKKKRVEKGETT